MTEVAQFYHENFGAVKLGRPVVRHDVRTLRLARYLSKTVLPKAPSKVGYDGAVKTWPMYGNDALGDCTCAAAGHMVQAWSANAGRAVTPRDQAILDAYWGTGSRDDGRSEIDVLNYWRNTGVGGDRIEAYAAIDPRNHAMVRAAIWLFGGVYIGVSLPLTAQRQTNWSVVRSGGADAEPGSWGGHAVPLVGYSSRSATVITWGRRITASWGFLERYMDESYAVLSRDWLAAAGKAPSGFDLDALRRDLAAI